MISKWSKYFLAALIPALVPAVAGAERYNLQAPQSAIAQQIYDLHTLIFIICCVIFVLVFGVMTYSIIYHRKSVGHKAEQFHENTMVEIAWTVVPFIILIGMAIPATKTVLAMKDTSNPDVTIKATGYQWKWGYDYLHEGVSFYSTLSTPRELVTDKSPDGAKKRAEHANYLLEVDNHLVVPVGKKVRILTTANDVIHSWAMPALGVKQDAIPGFVRDTCAPMALSSVMRSSTSGSCAAGVMMVLPFASTAARIAFSVPITVICGKVIVAPVRRPLLPTTRWQGMTTAAGLAPQARATARTAFAAPIFRAISP